MDAATCYRARFLLPKEAAERLGTMLSELYWPAPDAVSLYESRGSDWRVDAFFTEAPDRESLIEFAAAQGAEAEQVAVEPVPDTDWVALTQSQLHPVKAGRFLIHGRHDREKTASTRWAIEIDAGQAFGTAHHGSTRGCLQALDHLARRARFNRVLDVGTGTGVLAIAAARLWRGRVVASDIDPLAARIAAGNIRCNRASRFVQTVAAAGLSDHRIRTGAPYDLVVANILARPLMSLARPMAAVARRRGAVVLSGITRDQAPRVAAAFKAAGFLRYREVTLDDWVTLTLRRS